MAVLHTGRKGGIGRRLFRVVKREIKKKKKKIQKLWYSKNLDYLEKSILKLQFLPL